MDVYLCNAGDGTQHIVQLSKCYTIKLYSKPLYLNEKKKHFMAKLFQDRNLFKKNKWQGC